MKLGHLGRGLVLAGATLLGSAATANAAPMLFTLEGEFFGNLSASVLFSYGAGQVDVAVTNTSTAGNPLLSGDPRLTGFAFNLPTGVTGISGFSSSLAGWNSLFSPNNINTPGQFGFFDAGGITGNNGFNGGHPPAGITRGATANFSFTLTGANLGSLTEGSFLSQYSFDPPGGADESEQYFIARFQRVGPLGLFSDVATPTGRPTATARVPEPTTLLLSGLGFLGMAALRRRRQA